tara:strand:- start:501 stop:1226 length:726 start_codon:yes stop_codon:yes gene_type:complete
MCDGGLTMAMMAMSAAQGVAQVKAQKQQAKAQAAAQSAASVREMQRQQMTMRSERMQQGDEETTIAQEQLKANREAEEAISTTTVAGEAAGVSGISAGLSIQDYERKNAEYQGALAMQTRMNDSARRLSLANSGQQYVSNMGQINKPIAQPDYLGTALGTAQNMMGAYQSGQLSKQATANANLTRTAWGGAQTNARKGLQLGAQGIYNAGSAVRGAGVRRDQAGVTAQRGDLNSLRIQGIR